jgi:hypothetical protein
LNGNRSVDRCGPQKQVLLVKSWLKVDTFFIDGS